MKLSLKTILALAATVAFIPTKAMQAETVYSLDVNLVGSDALEPGWTAINVNPDGSHPKDTGGRGGVTLDGIDFFLLGGKAGRLRGTEADPAPNALTADFVGKDGPNATLFLFLGEPKKNFLPEGIWNVEIYSWDSDVPAPGFGDQTVGYRKDEITTLSKKMTANASSEKPAGTFQIVSDGVSDYDIFITEKNPGDQARLSAVRLTLISKDTETAK